MTAPAVGLIWAEAAGGVIGASGQVPWHLPEDLALFRAVTTATTVVMGRRTWESLPPRFRPLPGRRNLVLTRQAGWSAPGAERLGDVETVRGLDVEQVWVVGGAEVYAALLPVAVVAVTTQVDLAVAGDAYAPVLGPGWERVRDGSWSGERISAGGIRYAVTLRVREADLAAPWYARLQAALATLPPVG